MRDAGVLGRKGRRQQSVLEEVTQYGNWITVLQGCSGKQCKPHTSPRSEGAAVFIHQFQRVFGEDYFWGLRIPQSSRLPLTGTEQLYVVLGNEALRHRDTDAGS